MDNFIFALDSPGWGGSEINFARVIEFINPESGTLILNPKAFPEVKALGPSYKLNIVFNTVPNAQKYCFIGFFKAYKIVRKYNNSIFIIWSHHLDSNRWLQLYLAFRGKNFIIVEQLIPSSSEDLKKSKLTIPLKSFIAKRVRTIVLNAKSQLEHYTSMCKIDQKKITIISNSRDINKINNEVKSFREQQTNIKLELGLNDNLTVLNIGRLDFQKGQIFILEAGKYLQENGINLNIILAGNGPDEKILKLKVSEFKLKNVYFLGEVNCITKLFAVTDYFVFPSLFEGLPGALIEAMAAGLPCIASNIPGNNELIINGKTGILIDPSNSGELAKAILELVNDKELAFKYAEAGYNHVLNNYDESIEKNGWQTLFGELYAE